VLAAAFEPLSRAAVDEKAATKDPSRRRLSASVSAFLDHLKDAFRKRNPDELVAYIGD
jgi:arginyl-tRNA synthetase